MNTAYAYTFIDWQASYTTDLKNYVVGVFSDLAPYILIVLGLGIAIWFINRLLHRGE